MSSSRTTTTQRARAGVVLAAAGAVSLSLLAMPTSTAATKPSTNQSSTKQVKKGAGFARLTPPAEVPLARVPFTLAGSISHKMKGRPVNLQVKKGGWSTIATAKTTSKGIVRYPKVVLKKTSVVRIKANKWSTPKSGNFVFKINVSKPVTITVGAGQSGRLSVLPGVVQQGAGVAAPVNATQAVATFSPARLGRTVTLQRLQGKDWAAVARGKQDGSGSVGFTLPDTHGTYRAVAASMSGVPAATSGEAKARDFNLIFEDTFDAVALDDGKWADETTIDGNAFQRSCARVGDTARTVAGGSLNMGVTKDITKDGVCNWVTTGASGTNDWMVNTQVTTRDKFAFTYGYAAARMKLQADKGMHSSFWMQPQPGSDKASAEIDVMEFFGRTDKGEGNLAAFVHEYLNGAPHRKHGGVFTATDTMKPVGDTWWNSYHVFSVEWTSQGYVFRVDGREFHRETNAVSHSPQYLLLSMLTSDYELPNLSADRMAQSAAVDWVRVWK